MNEVKFILEGGYTISGSNEIILISRFKKLKINFEMINLFKKLTFVKLF